MDQNKVRMAFATTNELVDIVRYAPGEGLRIWEIVFNALISEPVNYSNREPNKMELLLNAVGGAHGLYLLSKESPELFGKLASAFDVTL